MRIAVLGAGSWGTTFAALVSKRNETLLWAREPEVATDIDQRHLNSAYLAGFELPDTLRATSDLERATASVDVLVMAVPTQWFRTVLAEAAPHVRPWIPVVSLAKGFEPGTGLRMSQVAEELLPGHRFSCHQYLPLTSCSMPQVVSTPPAPPCGQTASWTVSVDTVGSHFRARSPPVGGRTGR